MIFWSVLCCDNAQTAHPMLYFQKAENPEISKLQSPETFSMCVSHSRLVIYSINAYDPISIIINHCHQVMHDARLLAKVLYGKGKTNTAQAQTTESKPATKIQEGPKTRRELKFSSQSGQFFVHPSLVYDDCHQPGEETGHKVLDQACDQTDPTSSLLTEKPPNNPCQDDPACYVWRSQDYSFLPVRPPDQVN